MKGKKKLTAAIKEFTAELLKQVEQYAELQFQPEEIAIIMSMEPGFADEMKDPKRASFQAYQRGRLKAEAEVRKSILEMAKHGSTPAQKQFLDLNRQSKAGSAGDFDTSETKGADDDQAADSDD